MEELLAGIEEDERAIRSLRPGEVVEGIVASVSGDDALVDLGDRFAGVLSLREASGEGTDFAVGDSVVAAVIQPETRCGPGRSSRLRRQATSVEGHREEASSQLEEGQVRDGTVASVTTFGVFEPTTLYRPGDSVRVPVTGVERERGRTVGTDVDATVTRVTPNGAFARVTTGIEGLIHISEIASRRIATPAEVVQPGDLLRVRVVAIDPDRRRLSLSVPQAAGNVMYATRTEQDANV